MSSDTSSSIRGTQISLSQIYQGRVGHGQLHAIAKRCYEDTSEWTEAIGANVEFQISLLHVAPYRSMPFVLQWHQHLTVYTDASFHRGASNIIRLT